MMAPTFTSLSTAARSPVDSWLSSRERLSVRREEMRPDQPRPVFKEDGYAIFNRYRPPVHPTTGGSWTTTRPVSLLVAVMPDTAEQHLADFVQNGSGPLTSNIPEAGGFFRTRPDLESPDVEFHFAPSMFFDEGLTAPHDHAYCFGPVIFTWKATSRR